MPRKEGKKKGQRGNDYDDWSVDGGTAAAPTHNANKANKANKGGKGNNNASGAASPAVQKKPLTKKQKQTLAMKKKQDNQAAKTGNDTEAGDIKKAAETDPKQNAEKETKAAEAEEAEEAATEADAKETKQVLLLKKKINNLDTGRKDGKLSNKERRLMEKETAEDREKAAKVCNELLDC